MKNLLGVAVFLAIAAIVASKLYERAKEMEWIDLGDSEEEMADKDGGRSCGLPFPDDVELRNRSGRVLEVTLVGRSESHVQFRRAGDHETFVYAIDQLDSSSQQLVRNYVITGIQNASEHLQRGEMTLSNIQVENLRNEVKRIDEKLLSLRKRHSASQSKTERRTIENEYEELQKQKVAFEEDIAELQSQ